MLGQNPAPHPLSHTRNGLRYEIAWLAGSGLTNSQIATVLGCHQKNVEKHLTKLYRDHGVSREGLHTVFTVGTGGNQ